MCGIAGFMVNPGRRADRRWIVELVGRIPARLKFRGFRGLKRLLRHALADRLPPEIRTRRKQGFGVPIGTGLRGPLAPVLHQLLAETRLRAGGVFDPIAIGRLVAEHGADARDHARTLWALLVFERWRTHYLGKGCLV